MDKHFKYSIHGSFFQGELLVFLPFLGKIKDSLMSCLLNITEIILM